MLCTPYKFDYYCVNTLWFATTRNTKIVASRTLRAWNKLNCCRLSVPIFRQIFPIHRCNNEVNGLNKNASGT